MVITAGQGDGRLIMKGEGSAEEAGERGTEEVRKRTVETGKTGTEETGKGTGERSIEVRIIEYKCKTGLSVCRNICECDSPCL